MAGSLSRSAAAKASLAAKAGLGVAALAVFGVVVALKNDIPNPTHTGVDPSPEGTDGPSAAVRPVNFSTMGRSLTLAGEFPPPVEEPIDDDGTFGEIDPPDPIGSGTPEVTFLGAIAEPGRFVALLNINGRQKFLGPGESFGQVRVLECSATEVSVQFENADGSVSERESIAVSERTGPGWTAAAPSVAADPNAMPTGEMPMEGGGMPGMPSFPPGFNPASMTPEQLQMMRREMEAARGGDGSQ